MRLEHVDNHQALIEDVGPWRAQRFTDLLVAPDADREDCVFAGRVFECVIRNPPRFGFAYQWRYVGPL